MNLNPLNMVAALFKPISEAYQANQARKTARETARAKLELARSDQQHALELSDQEWEALSADKQDTSWKDEYVTVSVVSIINLIVIGGIAAAFGKPQILEGVAIGITALANAGVDVGFILNAVVLAAIGLKVWRLR